MMKSCMSLVLVVGLMSGCAHADPGGKKLDGPGSKEATAVTCGYTSAFKVTLAALGDDHFHALYGNGGKPAERCIQDWAGRLNGSAEPAASNIQQALLAVDLAFDTYPSYKPKLHELIADRLSGDLARNQPILDTKLTDLVDKGFAFRLFSKDSKYHDAALRTEVAQLFTRGRFNTHTWNKIYTDDKYIPNDYIDSDITLYIGLAQEYGVLPVIDDSIFPCTTTRSGEPTAAAANDYCCCNVSAHGATYYRKCKANAAGYNCTPTTGGNCYLASQNCPSAHSHP